MITPEETREFDGRKFCLLMVYPKPRGKTPQPPTPDLTAYGQQRIVDLDDSYALYFRGNGAKRLQRE